MSRWRAAGIHLAISILIAAIAFTAIYFAWYPGALFRAAGGLDLFTLLAGTDVVIGPIITLIIFKAGKKGLKMDLAIIGAVQLAALVYGASILYQSRPVWTVFLKDRFELARANQVMDAERRLARPPFDELSVTGPRLAGALPPKDPSEQLRIAITAIAGQDVHTYPQYLVPYDEVRAEVKKHAQPLDGLRRFNPTQEERIARLGEEFGRPPSQLGFLPMRAGRHDVTAIVDTASGDFLGTVALRPWEYE